MQALYSALELLGRSAKSGGDNMLKVERACDLAKRAIGFHEKSTMGVLEILTSTQSPPVVFDLEQLAGEAVHFLRNDAAIRSVKITLVSGAKPHIVADRGKFQVLLVGLLTAAIDETAPGSELTVTVERREEFGVVSLGSTAGYEESFGANELLQDPQRRMQSRELTFLFARQVLSANGGRLAIATAPDGDAVLQIVHPCLVAHA